jgi:iron complex transport system substrate-binding protein
MKKQFLLISFILTNFLCVNIQSFSAEVPKLRIISLAPSTTEILFALDLDEEIIGVSAFCDYPPKAREKEKVGTFSQPNIERILSLKPDIIFCTGLEQAPAVRELRQLNLKVYVSDPVNIDELFISIKDIACLTHKEKEAEELIKKMKVKIEEINSKIKLIPQEKRPKVFVEIWHDPLMTAGKDSFINELLILAGGMNIAYDTKRPYSYFSPEQVIARNPDRIILGYMSGKDNQTKVGERFGWKGINAVKNNRVYNDINPDLFLRPGPRLTEGLEEIYKRLYPK